MKKVILIILSMVCIQTTFADDFAKLRIKIEGATSNNQYFLCVGSAGCVSVKMGDHGTVYPMQPGSINYIYTTSIANMRVYPQPLPSSCNTPVKIDQTVVISGRIVKSANDNVRIEHLNCRIT